MIGAATIRAWFARARAPRDRGLEILFGLGAVARYLGVSRKQARSLAVHGLIPCFDLGGVTCARRATLRQHVEQLEAEGVMRAVRQEGQTHG